MTMELQVTITLSDRLFLLLEDKLPDLGRTAERALTKQVGRITREESEVKVEVKPVVTEEEPSEPEAPKPEAPKGAAPKLEERIRDVMDRTRKRIEGYDYATNTASEGYKRYHKALNNEFRRIANTLGYDKPSMIDDEDKAVRFALECDTLTLDDKGEITYNLPY